MVHFKMCCYGDAGGNVIKGQHNQQLTLVDSLSFIYSHYFAAKDLNLRFQCGTGAVFCNVDFEKISEGKSYL